MMNIYAHRGIVELYPENSLEAISESISNGFAIEIDIRFTKDGEIILLHDDNLNRLFGKDIPVKKVSSEVISSMTFLSAPDKRIAFLKDLHNIIKLNKGANVAIHFKQEEQNTENCDIIVASFRCLNLHEHCFLFNAGLETCRYLKAIDPSIKLGIIVSDERFEPFVYLWDDIGGHLDLFDIIWAAEYEKLYSEAFFGLLGCMGKKIIVVSNELHRSLGHPKAFQGYSDAWPVFQKSELYGVCTEYPYEFRTFMKRAVVY